MSCTSTIDKDLFLFDVVYSNTRNKGSLFYKRVCKSNFIVYRNMNSNMICNCSLSM